MSVVVDVGVSVVVSRVGAGSDVVSTAAVDLACWDVVVEVGGGDDEVTLSAADVGLPEVCAPVAVDICVEVTVLMLCGSPVVEVVMVTTPVVVVVSF